MISYNEMMAIVNAIYGQGQGATVQGATVLGATVPDATVPGATVPGATVPGTAVPNSQVQYVPVQYVPVQQTPVQTPYTPVLPNQALQTENDVLKDVIATLQKNAIGNPVNGYTPETSDSILSNLINPPMPAK